MIELIAFGAAGLVNTAVDFVLFNRLASLRGWSELRAHCWSSSAAMLLSFFLNRHVVFPGSAMDRLPQFLAVTLFATYVVQTSVLALMGRAWPSGGAPAPTVVRRAFRRNLAKGIATVASLVWNFAWYKFYVFAP